MRRAALHSVLVVWPHHVVPGRDDQLLLLVVPVAVLLIVVLTHRHTRQSVRV